ncbi:MAG: hypothetical protein WCD02_22585 [Terriglobales bacterium]
MNKQKQGLSQRGYAKHCHVNLAYVQQMIQTKKIPTLSDGSIDPDAADEARARNTNMARGELRKMRQAALEGSPMSTGNQFPTCSACGDTFSMVDARQFGVRNPVKFCTPKCEGDAEAGLSRRQIKRKIYREANA